MVNVRKPVVKKLKWGVAGCGRFSEHTFIPTIKFLRRSFVQSFYSHNLNRAKELAELSGASGYFDSYDEFLKSDIDCVFIGSVNAHHYEQVIKAAEAGKIFFVKSHYRLPASKQKKWFRSAKKIMFCLQ